MTNILVVDDDKTLLKFLSEYLRDTGLNVLTTDRSETALRLLYEERPELVILDVMMPGMDGYVLASRIREISSVPMIMLTAKTSEADKLRGFRLGVDDYVTKPFSFAELAARIKAVLNRSQSQSSSERQVHVFGQVTVDLDRWDVSRDGQPISLSPTEFKMLKFLLKNADKWVPNKEVIHMTQNSSKKENRQKHNLDLLRRMRTGEALYSFDSQSSWYPPRPILEKDAKALTELYGKDGEKRPERRSPNRPLMGLVKLVEATASEETTQSSRADKSA